MKGIELSQLYYGVYGKTMIREKFPEYESRIAVGLVGQGSECFGFDDVISTDHDFGPGFLMWLTDEDYAKIGNRLNEEYDRLPKEFKGFKRINTARATNRVGAVRISDFYDAFVGDLCNTQDNMKWLHVPEKLLATATNGKVYRDDYGEFTRIREKLKEFYPEDVRIKKMVARATIMAQAGQYNYSRCMKRNENVAASIALSEFVSATTSMIYLLNREYMPYYKWSHHGLKRLSRLGEVSELLEELVMLPPQNLNWKNLDEVTFFYGINFKDKKVELIERICEMVLKELEKEGLIAGYKDLFMENYLDEMTKHIKDSRLRLLHVMEG